KDPNTKVVGRMRQTFDMVRSGNVIYYTEVEDQLPLAVVEEAPYSLEIVKPAVPLVAGGLLDLKVVAKRKEGFKAPIRVFMIWKPPGISTLGEQTIAEGKNECSFTLDANPSMAAGQWKLTVMGEADAGNGRVYNASPFCEVTTAPAFLTAPTMAMAVVEQGKETEFLCKLEHTQPFSGDAEAQVIGVPDTIVMEPGKLNKDTKEVSFKVKTSDKSPVGKQNNLFVVVKLPVPGGTTTHRIATGSSLRIDAPRKAPAAAPAAQPQLAQNKPAEAPKPTAKPLSRLEQLRQEATGKK
ncbi:MAG: peptidase, partial [Roseimicrobium sp.]